MDMRKIGEWAFLLGIIIAVLVGILVAWLPTVDLQTYSFGLALLMLVIGIVVGFLNVTEKETTTFLVAAIALMVASAVQWSLLSFGIGTFIGTLLAFIGAFVAPAAVIVAVKAVWALAKEA